MAEETYERREHRAERGGARRECQPSAPERRNGGRDLELAVRHRAVEKELPWRLRPDDEKAGLVEQDHQQERQQGHRGQVEGDRHGLVIAAVQPVRGQIQADERQAEDEQRCVRPSHGAVPPLGREIEQAAGNQQERSQVQRDLRIGQGAALDDPVVFARIERPVCGAQDARLVRVNQPQTQPFRRFVAGARQRGPPSVVV